MGAITPLELESMLDESNGTVAYLAKGHVEPERLEVEVQRQIDEDFEIKYAKKVEQTTMRKIPTPWHDDWAFVYEYSEPGRGAFKCTVAWID